ncbi:MAG: class I SAM-dependent methyltransferase [Methylobacterium mesophilicum]|nr:class I SAM-dependent methyltransferase [Methylobacterium mesophilicum]
MSDAVTFHSGIAERFEGAYAVSPAFRERLLLWSAMIERYGRAGMRVLDAGCGPGLIAAQAARAASHVLAFDASPAMVSRARANLPDRVECVIGRLETLDFGPRPFDLVLASSLLEYCDPFWPAFDRLLGALAPEGTLLVSLPNDASRYRKVESAIFRLTGHPRYRAHLGHVPSRGALERGLAERQLSVESTTFYGAAAYLPAWLRPHLPPQLTGTLVLFAIRRVGP